MRKEKSKGNINIGDKHNCLTAIEFVYHKPQEYKSKKTGKIRTKDFPHWKFKCDCGNEEIYPVGRVLIGARKSCGCKNKEVRKQNGLNKRLEFGFSAKKNLLSSYICSARSRDIEFKLSEDEFYWLTQQNCSYCNSGLLGESKTYTNNGSYLYNGIDRVDSKIGYIFENCVPCCKFCNMAKKNYSVEEFLKWLNNIRNLSNNIIS